jgi:hypothetical protein
VERRERDKQEVYNPKGATKRAVFLPLAALAAVAVVGTFIVRFLVPANEHPKRQVEDVKTPEQELAEREVEKRKLEPAPTKAELAPVAAPAEAVAQGSLVPVMGTAPAAPAPIGSSTQRPHAGGSHRGKTAQAAAPAAAARPHHRSLDSDMATGSTASATPVITGPVGVAKGTLIPCKLLSPANPQLQGPVMAVTVKDAAGVPAGSKLICAASGAAVGRVNLTCDTLQIEGRGQLPIVALAMGLDQQPGIPTEVIERSNTKEQAKSDAIGAVSAAANVAAGAIGGGVPGALGSGGTNTATNAARNASTSSTTESAAPAPRGTRFSLFIQQAF